MERLAQRLRLLPGQSAAQWVVGKRTHGGSCVCPRSWTFCGAACQHTHTLVSSVTAVHDSQSHTCSPLWVSPCSHSHTAHVNTRVRDGWTASPWTEIIEDRSVALFSVFRVVQLPLFLPIFTSMLFFRSFSHSWLFTSTRQPHRFAAWLVVWGFKSLSGAWYLFFNDISEMLSGHSLKATERDEFLAIRIQLTEYRSSPRKLLSQREPAATSSILYFPLFLRTFKRNPVSPAASNQFTNENGQNVWFLSSVLCICRISYNKECDPLQVAKQLKLKFIFPADVSVLWVFLLQAIISLLLFGLARLVKLNKRTNVWVEFRLKVNFPKWSARLTVHANLRL